MTYFFCCCFLKPCCCVPLVGDQAAAFTVVGVGLRMDEGKVSTADLPGAE